MEFFGDFRGLYSLKNHRLGEDDFFGADILHNRHFHGHSKFVGDIGFGVVKVFRKPVHVEIFFDVHLDVIDDIGDKISGDFSACFFVVIC